MIEEGQVMDDAAIARPQLGGLHPAVGRKIDVEFERLIVDQAAVGNFERLVHFDHDVGLGNPPALDKRRRRRQIRLIAFGAAVARPGRDQFLFAVGQAGVVQKMAVLGIGMPGRHAAAGDDLDDCFGPGGRLVVGGERERSDLARSMTTDAMLIENRGDLLWNR